MDRAEVEDERETLKGIMAMLLGLATLTEFLCLLPLSVRALALPFLRPAETAARAFAAEWTGGVLALPRAAVRNADAHGCDEALQLARCFRVLAAIFNRLQDSIARRLLRGRPNGRFAQRAPAMGRQCRVVSTLRAMTSRQVASPDTS